MAEKELYIYQDKYITSIFTKTAKDHYSDICSYWAINLSVELYNKSKLYKLHKNKAKNEIAWIYRKHFGRILLTTVCIKNNEIYFKRKVLGLSQRVESEFLALNIEKNRKFIKGQTLWNNIEKTGNENLFSEFSLLINIVFDKYILPNGKLNGKCYDMTTGNCVIDENGVYRFFDFEFTMKGGVSKNYYIWRVIRNSPVQEELKEELYNKLCRAFNITPDLKYCNYIYDTTERFLISFPYRKDDEIFKKYQNSFYFRFFTNLLGILNFCPKLKSKLENKILYPKTSLFKIYFQEGDANEIY